MNIKHTNARTAAQKQKVKPEHAAEKREKCAKIVARMAARIRTIAVVKLKAKQNYQR